jgi:hypothetical protein
MRISGAVLTCEMPHRDDPTFVRVENKAFREETQKLEHSEIIKCRLLRSHPAYQDNLNLLASCALGGRAAMVDLRDDNEIHSVAVGVARPDLPRAARDLTKSSKSRMCYPNRYPRSALA